MIIVISGPSGVGKSTIINKLSRKKHLYYCVSSTTRKIRKNEVNGIDYNFLTSLEFNNLIQKNQFIEYETYDKNLYGTTYQEISKESKYDAIILDLEVNGAINIINEYQNSIGLFIDINNTLLRERLIKRGHTDKDFIQTRLKLANNQRKHIKSFKYNVFNNEINATVKQVSYIINNEIL